MKRNNKKKETFIVVTIFAERSTVVHRNLRRAKIRLLSICLERDVSLVKRGKIFRRTIFHSRRIRYPIDRLVKIHPRIRDSPPTCTFDRKYFSGDCTWLLTLFMTSIAITLPRCAFQGY